MTKFTLIKLAPNATIGSIHMEGNMVTGATDAVLIEGDTGDATITVKNNVFRADEDAPWEPIPTFKEKQP